MITYLTHYFSPDTREDDEYCLAISAGKGGARLTHSHARQYNFALQVGQADDLCYVMHILRFACEYKNKGHARFLVWAKAAIVCPVILNIYIYTCGCRSRDLNDVEAVIEA